MCTRDQEIMRVLLEMLKRAPQNADAKEKQAKNKGCNKFRNADMHAIATQDQRKKATREETGKT